MSESGEVDLAQVKEEIASEIARVHETSYGTSGEFKVYLLEDLVVVMIDVVLAESEATLIAAGRGDAVKATREAFQEVIGPSFMAIVERATGRRVKSFVSHMNVDPPFEVELFRLEAH